MSEIAHIYYDFHALVPSGYCFQFRDGIIGGCVINENVFVVVFWDLLERFGHSLVKKVDIPFFVVAARDDTNKWRVQELVLVTVYEISFKV